MRAMLDQIPQIHHALEIFGVLLLAATGALAAVRARMDFLGAMVMAFVVGNGGGTLRDLMLNRHPLGWMRDETLLLMPLVTGLAIYGLTLVVGWRPLARHDDKASRLGRLLIWADAVGLAVFCVTGAQVALAQGASIAVTIVMAGITCVGGGMLRDILVNQVPLVLRGDLYMTPALVGAGAYVALYGPIGVPAASAAAFAICLGVRAAAILFGLNPARR